MKKDSKNSIKHYVFEFMVVFVAVFLGFLADNYRETLADRTKEQEYAISLLKDLKGDSIVLANLIITNEHYKSRMSAFNRNSKLDFHLQENLKRFYIDLLASSWAFANIFVPNEVTLVQLKSTGDIRLFKEPHVADSITKYMLAIEDLRHDSDWYLDWADRSGQLGFEVCDYFDYGRLLIADSKNAPNAPPLTNDKDKLRLFFNTTNELWFAADRYNKKSSKLLKSMSNLIVFLEATYNLKN